MAELDTVEALVLALTFDDDATAVLCEALADVDGALVDTSVFDTDVAELGPVLSAVLDVALDETAVLGALVDGALVSVKELTELL